MNVTNEWKLGLGTTALNASFWYNFETENGNLVSRSVSFDELAKAYALYLKPETRWIKIDNWHGEGYPVFKCPECGAESYVEHNYCPKCGLKMKGNTANE